MKYELKEAIYLLRRELMKYVSTSPMRVYAIACCLELEEEARRAAKTIRELSVQNTYVKEMEDMTAGAYQRLLDYCEKCVVPLGVFSPPLFPPALMNFCRPPPSTSSTTSPSSAASIATDASSDEPKVTKPGPPPFCLADADLDIVSCDHVIFKVLQSQIGRAHV